MANDIAEILTDLSAYDEPTRHVERVETHISWVFLTDHHAYKVKKPVKYDFLDFSSVDLRRAACEAEVRLNRRLAPDVYLGVVPLTRDGEWWRVGGEGPAEEWIVKMRRLPADRSLEALMDGGHVTEEQIADIVQVLTEFYKRVDRAELSPEQYRARVMEHVRGNHRELSDPVYGLDQHLVRRLFETQLRYLLLAQPELDARVANRRIVDGHGDLRPEHIYLLPHPVVIDCIEFSREFREIDVLDELAFLKMECAARGAKWIGDSIRKQYCAAAEDEAPIRLHHFYAVYRASVRAKVMALRARQLTGDLRQHSLYEASKYLRLANAEIDGLGKPFCLMVGGLSGSGKSTIARELAGVLGATVLETDAVRHELFGASSADTRYDEGHYSPENRQRVYDELLRRAEDLLRHRLSVILDGTFLDSTIRHAVRSVAYAQGAELVSFQCHCAPEIARRRIVTRQQTGRSKSEARPDIYNRQLEIAAETPWGEDTISIDTEASVDDNIQRCLAVLMERYPTER